MARGEWFVATESQSEVDTAILVDALGADTIGDEGERLAVSV